MAMIHPSDEQLQAYLDDRDAPDSKRIETHLRQCPACSGNLKTYQELYTELRAEKIPPISLALRSAILDRVGRDMKQSSGVWETLFIVVFFVGGLLASFYFIKPLQALLVIGKKTITSLLGYSGDITQLANGSLWFILAAVLIFILIELLDNKLIKPRL